MNFKKKPFRDPKYLAWVRTKPCMTCGSRDNVQASHIGSSNFGSKPPDNQTIPQCGRCHYIYEYYKHDFEKQIKKSLGSTRPLPTLEDCEFYFNQYLSEKK